MRKTPFMTFVEPVYFTECTGGSYAPYLGRTW